jgi:hypothetical protein
VKEQRSYKVNEVLSFYYFEESSQSSENNSCRQIVLVEKEFIGQPL